MKVFRIFILSSGATILYITTSELADKYLESAAFCWLMLMIIYIVFTEKNQNR